MFVTQDKRNARGARILIVDDTPDNAHLLRQILEFSGFRAAVAHSGEQALQIVAAEPPDLILLDVMMPNMDGYEVTRQIRANAALPFIPIILVTARSAIPDKVEGLDSGADDYLVKPVNRHELLARVRGLLRLKRAQDALRAEQHKTALLYQLGRQLSSSLDLDMVLRLTIEQATQTFGAAQGCVLMLDEQGAPWRSIGVTNDAGEQTPSLEQIAAIVDAGFGNQLLDGPVIVDDTSGEPRWQALVGKLPGIGSAIATALSYQRQPLGVLMLFHQTSGVFHLEQRDLLVGMADQVSLALHNARLYTRLREAENAREQMLYLLAHDLRTPLSGVINCLELLGRDQSGEQDEELIAMALEACRYQDSMVGDLLDLHRAEAGQIELEVQPFDISTTIKILLDELKKKAEQKEIRLCADLAPALTVWADHGRLVRVISNLLRNALKYTPYKGIITISARVDEDDGFIRVCVEDTGHPLPPEALPRVFDRFYRPQEHQHSGRRGVGAGFAFCRQIVALHGGRIWAESDSRRGVRIFFTLPVVASHGEISDEQMADLDRRRRPATAA